MAVVGSGAAVATASVLSVGGTSGVAQGAGVGGGGVAGAPYPAVGGKWQVHGRCDRLRN